MEEEGKYLKVDVENDDGYSGLQKEELFIQIVRIRLFQEEFVFMHSEDSGIVINDIPFNEIPGGVSKFLEIEDIEQEGDDET